MPQTAIERWIRRYQKRLQWGVFLERAAECLAAFLFAFGAVVLSTKLMAPGWWPGVLWLAAGLVPSLLVAYGLARRNCWTRREAVARLDSALGAGGLLMTVAEHPDDNWSQRLPSDEMQWRSALPHLAPRRFLGMLCLPVLFAVGACFVPLRHAVAGTVLKNTVAQKVTQDLQELVTELEQEPVLEPEEQKQMREEIEKLAQETEQSPLTHEKWEAVDTLRERAKVRLDSAAMLTSQAQAAAATLAESEGGDQLSMERQQQLEKELGQSLERMAGKGAFSKAPPGLQAKLQKLMKDGKFQAMPKAPDDRQELLSELNEFLKGESNRLGDLRQRCMACSDNGKCEGDGSEGAVKSNLPGRGGVNRGRGDANLSFGDESDAAGIKFKELVLPPGFQDQPNDDTSAVQFTAPEESPAESAPRGAQRSHDPASGGETWNRKLKPRHRQVVRKYFESK